MELDSQVIAAGRLEGIPFAFEKVTRTPNTLDAHGLIWLAGQHGCQDSIVESLFQAYFVQGKEIGGLMTLIELACDAGLDRELVASQLGLADTRAIIVEAAEGSRLRGVAGVPFFTINQETTLSGAQLPATFLEAFERAIRSGKPL